MKNSILKGMLAAVIVLVAFTGRPLLAAASGAEQISVTFTLVDYPNADPGTCNPSTYLPYAGDPACIAYLAAAYTETGDFVGTESEEDSLVFFANGGAAFAGYENWIGTLKGRGTGSFVVLGYDGIETPSGMDWGKLRIVDGTGTGDLVGISGSGRYTGSAVTGIIATKMTVEFPRP